MNAHQREIDIQNTLQKIDLGMAKIAPLVTKSLIEEFEKTGVSPVFSKDGQITGLKLIEAGKETSLIEKIHWKWLEDGVVNYSLNNFWFLEYNQTKPENNTIYPIFGLLLVVSKETGKSKEYNVGNNSTFPNELIQDIKNNFFQ